MARKAKPISISSIAAELGVSASAVSRVINNRAGVSEETRRRVGALLEKYRFRPNYPASRLPRLAVVTGSTRIAPYTAAVLSGIYRCVGEGNISAATIVAPEEERGRLLDLIRDQQCSGVILIVPADFASEYAHLSEAGLPLMLVDERAEVAGAGYIDNDSYSGSLEAARHLIALGHRSIGYLRCCSRTSNHVERFEAYKAALAEAGIAFDPALVVEHTAKCGSLESGAEAMRKLLTGGVPLTAVMATNDEIAFGALSAAKSAGFRVPEMLSIVGFDDNDFAEFTDPPLTTVRHEAEEAGYLAACAIDEYLRNDTPLPRRVLPARLVVRLSSTSA